MKIDDIRALAAIMRENGLTALELDECGTHLRLESTVNAPVATPVVATAPAAAPSPRPRTTTAASTSTTSLR